MVFKRINKDTVRCILSEQDMIDNGLRIEDFFKDQEKVQDFLEDLVEQAREEVGYETGSGMLTMQVMPLPNRGLAITFSEDSGSRLGDMLGQIKELVGGIIPDEDFVPEENDKEKDSNVNRKELKKYEGRIFAFNDLESIEMMCQSLELPKFNKSVLYKDGEKYYMLLKKGKLSKVSYDSLCFSILEYGELITDDVLKIACWQEHHTPLIKKNAIGILKNI